MPNEDIELGEVRVDPATNSASLILKKDLDEVNRKRWCMKLDVAEEKANQTMGVISETKKDGQMKLQTMIDKRVTCIAKNYKVDYETKLSINQMDKGGIKLFEAPTDPLDPVFLKKNDEREIAMNSDSESDNEANKQPQFHGLK